MCVYVQVFTGEYMHSNRQEEDTGFPGVKSCRQLGVTHHIKCGCHPPLPAEAVCMYFLNNWAISPDFREVLLICSDEPFSLGHLSKPGLPFSLEKRAKELLTLSKQEHPGKLWGIKRGQRKHDGWGHCGFLVVLNRQRTLEEKQRDAERDFSLNL